MRSSHSLEEQRDAILSRMEASREQYRRMLMEDSNPRARENPVYNETSHGSSMVDYQSRQQHRTPNAADMALAFVKRHPLMCVAAVAAIFAIGPRRMLRGAVSGGTTLTALTLRNPKNIGMLTRLLSTVAGYARRGGMRSR